MTIEKIIMTTATPIQYLWAKMSAFYDVLPLEDVRPKDVSREEYLEVQLQMMENSQDASVMIAYEAANQEVSFHYHGVRVVAVEEDMPAEKHLKEGDLITMIDGETINESDHLVDYIAQKEAGNVVSIEFMRDDEPMNADITLETFTDPGGDNKVGLGIRLISERSLEVEPDVQFSSGNIGGPSAGLMFALEIYNQLTEEDISKGYQLIGSGEIDYDGAVKSIGQIDKKVVAADQANCEIFFAPNKQRKGPSNYEVAKETAETIGTDMEIVPIGTFAEALEYLQGLERKESN